MITKFKLYVVQIISTEGFELFFNITADTFGVAIRKANAIFKEISANYRENTLRITDVREANMQLWEVTMDSQSCN